MLDSQKLFENLKKVNERIFQACERSGRDPKEVTLVAATKNVELKLIAQAYGFGLKVFGENRIQEASSKIPVLAGDIKWHLIGHLQKNKVSKALELNFELIESLDSLELAKLLNEKLQKLGRSQKVLLEINIANEPQKHGFKPEAMGEIVPRLGVFKNLEVVGLMTMGPDLREADQMRPYFAKARKIAVGAKFKILSMGMSKDFEIAIEEGATMIRIGRALFGEN